MGYLRFLVRFRQRIHLIRYRYRLKYRHFKEEWTAVDDRLSPWLRVLSWLLVALVVATWILPLQFPGLFDAYVPAANRFLLGGFFVHFVLRAAFSGGTGFWRTRWAEGLFATGALVILSDVWGEQVGRLYADAIEVYLFVLVGIKAVAYIPRWLAASTNPARTVLLCFGGLIGTGAVFLRFPAASVADGGLGWTDAVFLAASAVCVTGLSPLDIATQLTGFGQAVLLVLIQLGGIGVVTFATFLAMYLSGGIGRTERFVLRDVIQEADLRAVSSTLKSIVGLTLAFECVGAVALFLAWGDLIPHSSDRAWFALFHSVSAFCNAGFSLFTNGLADPSNAGSWGVNLTVMGLILAGGLGFTTWNEVRTRKANQRWSLHTTIVARMTVLLVVGGTLAIAALEWNGVLGGLSWQDKWLAAAFQSVTTRTAGFNTVSISELAVPTLMIMMIWMAVGGAPGSTAGGIKMTTVYVLAASAWADLRGRTRLEIHRRTVPEIIQRRALSAALLAVAWLLMGTLLLTMTETAAFQDLLFEQVSAFMTVGLSRGVTPELSTAGKWIVTASMFMGRVGMLTLAVAFTRRITTERYRYPSEGVLIA